MMTRWIVPLLLAVLIVSALCSLAAGSAPVPVWAGLADWIAGRESAAALVIGDIRLPRTLLALAVGACLGLAGAALQGLLRNPLADPGLTGASAGAALGAAVVFYFGPALGWLAWAGQFAPVLAGLVGAGVALLAVLALAGAAQSAQVLLAGLAVSTLAGALLAVALNFAPNPYAMQELVFWLLGSVSERGLAQLWVLLPALIAGGALIWSQRALLAALALGEPVARSLGLDFARGARLVVLGAALLVGAAVAVAGAIGFVGLIVPHLVRPLVRHRPDKTLLPSALAGAALVNLADIAVRLLPPGREVKLGVLTTLIGAPLLIVLIWKGRREWM
jgi:iron complex transport system permease protein